MNFLTAKPPETIELSGLEYPIHTDFRVFLEVESLLQEEGEEGLFKALSLFYGGIPTDVPAAADRFAWFYRCGKPVKETKGKGQGTPQKPTFSFTYDGELIYAAFLDQYGIDLAEEKLHWWKFMALFEALKPDHMFCEIRKCRAVKITNDMSKAQKEYYSAMKKQYALPLPEKLEKRQAALEQALLNGGDVSGLLGKSDET